MASYLSSIMIVSLIAALSVISTESSDSCGLRPGFVGVSAFQAYLKGYAYVETGSDMPFKKLTTNYGGNFNVNSSEYIAPLDGLYYFHVSVRVEDRDKYLYLRVKKNGNNIGMLSTGDKLYPRQASTAVLIDLKKDDRVKVTVDQIKGATQARVSHWLYTTFVGYLMYAK